MSKAILEFNTSDPEENKALQRALKSTNMAIILFQIIHNLKKKCEHIADGLEADSDKYDGIYVVFQQIEKLLEEHKVDIDELID